MKQYIDKDAVVAEIEKAIDSPAPSHDQQCDWEDGYWCGLSTAECIIDTLEVKGVDLEKEIQEAQRNYKTIEEYKGYPCTMYADDIEWIAKHFYELGLKAKGE